VGDRKKEDGMELQVEGKHVFAADLGPGDAPPLLLIHGAGGSHRSWGAIPAELAASGLRVLVPDLPGHGASDGPAPATIPALAGWLAAFLTAAGAERAALAGHSMGALAALELAARHPGRVRRLALLGAAAAMPVNQALLDMARDDPPAAGALIAKWGFAKEPPPAPDLVAATAGLLADCPPGSLHAGLAACSAYAGGEAAAALVRCPAAVVIGGQDRMAPPEAGRALAAALPRGRAMVLGAAGHMMMADQPGAVRDALLDALEPDLDPEDWESFRAQAHRMLDESLDFIRDARRRPVWRPMPPEVRGAFDAPPPRAGQDLAEIDAEFRSQVEPFGPGNLHPAFMGWVHGAGTAQGMLAEMLAGGLNANLGGRDHAPIEVERQILRWMRALFGYPEGAGGLFVTGTSQANFLAVLTARTRALGADSRRDGLGGAPGRGEGLTAYASAAAHGCIPQAFEMSGLGSDSLRPVPVDAAQRIDLAALEQAIAADRAAGRRPFMLVGNAGTVDVGAIDDLDALAGLAEREGLWFHVDGAFGALGMMSPELAPLLAGIGRSDSIAFDFHKWGQVPYDAGYLLVRDGEAQMAAFASPAAYLRREARGLAAGSPWPCDFGPDLSRGFRALKAWVTLKAHGTEALGAAMARCCRVARHLARRVEAEPRLELLAPVALNIVCFAVRGGDSAEIVARLQESGVAAPSTTTLDGRLAIRCAIVNHRTREDDADHMLDAVLAVSTKQ
jgi:glutamate/tyrosine decarboxylase-like PLP-dependent enzyme/pimeloyl-ACP methyl ester carboxylesterase